MRTITQDVDRLADRIKELVAQGDEAREKADQYYIAAGIHLQELKEQKPAGQNWVAYAERMTGLKKSRIYELMAIGRGESTTEEIRANTAERQQRHRDAVPLRNGRTVNDSEADDDSPPHEEPSDEKTLEQAFLIRAGEALRYAHYEGPKNRRVLMAARQTAQAWMNLANQLNGEK